MNSEPKTVAGVCAPDSGRFAKATSTAWIAMAVAAAKPSPARGPAGAGRRRFPSGKGRVCGVEGAASVQFGRQGKFV